ncbi:MAG TPA: HAMP domain-containing sensor histidine kinase [Candidatus Kapabacteria bacterium]|nr:HAMP domain-containing sensor histidine kinase [Candidatus Kapabacteria bacterium]
MNRYYIQATIILTLFFLNSYNCFPINIYPFSLKILDKQNVGRQHVSFQSNGHLNYLIKQPSAEVPEQIYSWYGFNKDNSVTTIIPEGLTISSTISDSLLYILKSQTDGNFCYVLSPNLKVVSKIKIEYEGIFSFNSKVKWDKDTLTHTLYLLFDKTLYHIYKKDTLTAEIIAKNVVDFKKLYNNYKYIYLTGNDFGVDLILIEKENKEKFLARVLYSGEVVLRKVANQFVVMTSTSNESLSVIEIINKDRGIISVSDIPSKPEFIQINEEKAALKIYFLNKTEEEYYLNILNLKDLNYKEKWQLISIPKDLIEPICIKYIKNRIFAFFRNGIISINENGNIESVDYIALGETLAENFDIYFHHKYILLSSDIGSILLEEQSKSFWLLNKFYEQLGKILIPLILIAMIFIIYQMYKHQKRLLNAILNLPTTGICLVVDKQNRLVNANQIGKNILRINDNIPLKKSTDFYCSDELLEPLKDLCRKVNIYRNSFNQRISLFQDDEPKEWYCSITSIKNFWGRYRGFVLTGIDITEELERKRLNNWAQFAHDLQTNLSILRINSEMLELSNTDENIERRKKIINQIHIITNKIRDIVLVGRSDKLDIQRVLTSDIIEELKKEFDLTIYPNIEFNYEINNYFLECDLRKLVRALRNAVENSIRALKNIDRNGIIKFKVWEDGRLAHFAIIDNGEGMSEDSQKKILKPYFTTHKKQGGSGIGTMIMLRVMEMHGGRFAISSELNKGTEVVFTIPLKQ